jgi:hypothetical protein
MFTRHSDSGLVPPSLEQIRKRAQIIVIDDQAFPYVQPFKRDGYHITKWGTVQSLSQLTDGHFDLILLDLHGVGLKDSPTHQGLGILKAIKDVNPAQVVIAYSGVSWTVDYRDFFAMADGVLNKSADYVDFKAEVDRMLTRRASLAFFVARVNETLGDDAVRVPKVVPKVMRAIRRGRPDIARKYLVKHVQDEVTVDRVIAIVSLGITVLGVHL